MADAGFGMDRAALKAMLNKSKAKPINCALGKGGDSTSAYLLLDPIKQPKALAGLLQKEFADMKDSRHGVASVDTDTDPKLVTFRINRPSSGLAKRVLKALKLSGYNKVRFEFDDESEAETLGEEDEEAPAEAAAAPPAAPPAAAAPAPAAAAPIPSPPPPPPPPPLDAAQLTKTLMALAPKLKAIAGADATLLQTLEQSAAQAATALKTGDLATAATAIQSLRTAAETAARSSSNGTTPTGKPPVGHTVAVTQAMLLWGRTRSYLETQLQALEQAIIEQSGDETDFDEIKAAVPALSDVLSVLDTRLEAKLNQVQSTQDVAEKGRLRLEAKTIVSEYQTYISGEPLMAALDTNPFIKFDGAARVKSTLSAILTTL